MGISISSLRSSLTIIYNNAPHIILEYKHVKLARGPAFCQVKLKNLKTSNIYDCTLRDSDNIQEAFIEKRKLQYLYQGEDLFHFLDFETYEDLILNKAQIEDKIIWLRDNLDVAGIFYDNELIDLELPSSLNLKVIETSVGLKGDTVKLVTKPAKLETGLTIQVPIFIKEGETVKVDTRTKEYLGRA